MIKSTTKTNAKASLKLYNQINSYIFEQECGELKGVSKSEVEKLKQSLTVLKNIINKNK